MSASPRSFGPYLLERELGRGANGVVFLARREGSDVPYALKISTAGLDRETLIRARLEAEVTARLRHPGIVKVLDQGVHQGHDYLLMEYCEGEPLSRRLSRGPLPWREAVQLVGELARILAEAHGLGIVHRDLKPANVMLEGPEARPRVIDFGLARDPSLVRSLTQSSAMLGTPATMAPEQFRGSKVDARADVYALGAILYMCLTGRPPFRGADLADLGRQVCEVEPDLPRRLAPDVPAPIERVCLDALAKPPDWRPADAGALAAALDAALGLVDAAPAPRRRAVPGWVLIAGGLVLGAGASLAWILRDAGPRAPAEAATREAAVDTELARCLARARAFAPLSELLPLLDAAEAAAGDDRALRDRVRLERADMHRRRGDYAGCVAAAPVEVPGPVGTSARFLKALSLLRLGYDMEAHEEFVRLARDDPEGSRGLHAQAVLQLSQPTDLWGRTMQRALRADPTDVQAQLGAAYGLSALEGPEAALAAIDAVVAREPDEPHAAFERVFVLANAGRYEAALEAYRTLEERLAPYSCPQAAMTRASALIGCQRLGEAEAVYARVFDEAPHLVRAEVMRGYCAYAQGERSRAQAIWEEVCRKRDPARWETLLSRLPGDLGPHLREIAARLEAGAR
ncbi:MAG: protein kinase [Planctomycetota bacterium]